MQTCYTVLILAVLLVGFAGPVRGQIVEDFQDHSIGEQNFTDMQSGTQWSVANGSTSAIVGLNACNGTPDLCYGVAPDEVVRVVFPQSEASNITVIFQHQSGGFGAGSSYLDPECTVIDDGSDFFSTPVGGGSVSVPGTSVRCIEFRNLGSVNVIIDDLTFTATSLPVEIASFEAVADGEVVQLAWRTTSERNNAGFEVQVRSQGDFTPVGFVDGQGTTSTPQAYTYRVDNLMPGRYEFRLKQVDLDGTFTYSPVVAVSVEVPGTYALSDVYPNPFNPRAQFTLAVEQAQHVRIAVYNLLGEEVALLHDGTLAGETTHTFAFEAGTLPSGLYLVRVAGERFTAVRQALLLK